MNVIDLNEIRVLRRRPPEAPIYIVVMVENLSPGDLLYRLRGTGLALSNRGKYLVLHEAPKPPPVA